jgi:hypothetical protein
MDEDDLQSIVSTTDSINSYELLAATEEDMKKNCRLLYNAVAVASLHTSFYLQVVFCLCNAVQLMRKRKPKRRNCL